MPVQINGDGGINGGSIANGIGMVLIKPTSVSGGTLGSNGVITFSSSSGITINNCFSATYENYKLLWRVTKDSTSSDLRFQYTSAGTPASSGNYGRGAWSQYGNGLSGAYLQSSGGNTDTIQYFGAVDANAKGAGTLEFFSPYLADITMNTCLWFATAGGGSANMSGFVNGYHNLSNSYDGIKLYPGAGNFSGTVRIYGYNNG